MQLVVIQASLFSDTDDFTSWHVSLWVSEWFSEAVTESVSEGRVTNRDVMYYFHIERCTLEKSSEYFEEKSDYLGNSCLVKQGKNDFLFNFIPKG